MNDTRQISWCNTLIHFASIFIVGLSGVFPIIQKFCCLDLVCHAMISWFHVSAGGRWLVFPCFLVASLLWGYDLSSKHDVVAWWLWIKKTAELIVATHSQLSLFTVTSLELWWTRERGRQEDRRIFFSHCWLWGLGTHHFGLYNINCSPSETPISFAKLINLYTWIA